LKGKPITTNPLHDQRKLARRIRQKGGDDLLPSEVNQPLCFQPP